MDSSAESQDLLDRLPLTWQPGMSLRRQRDGLVIGRFFDAELSSVFQPIVDPATGTRIGFEAFVRCHAGGEPALSPWNLFSLAADDDTVVGLDRLFRTLHVLNDPRGRDDELLFLNVHGRLLAAVADDHGRAFRRVLDALGTNPSGIVIETPESASQKPSLAGFVLSNYRHNGFRIAANVTSLQETKTLLERVRPAFLKANVRHLRLRAEGETLRALAQEYGSGLILTRVARDEDLRCACALSGCFVQGHAIAEPLPPGRLSSLSDRRGPNPNARTDLCDFVTHRPSM